MIQHLLVLKTTRSGLRPDRLGGQKNQQSDGLKTSDREMRSDQDRLLRDLPHLSGFGNLTGVIGKLTAVVAAFLLVFLTSYTAQAQGSVSETYTAGDISTEYNDDPSASSNSSCPGVLSVTIPAGQRITTIDVAYDMTAHDAAAPGWKSDQRSLLECVTTGMRETIVTSGSGNSTGTQSYNRTNLTIAWDATTTVVFELHAWRTHADITPTCNNTYNTVDNNTWTVTVHYVPVSPPVLTTDPVSAITAFSAASGGNISSNGGDPPVTDRGVCWNTAGSPTTSDFTFSSGTGTGSFTGDITGLSSNTEYYVRSYATNGEGTAYGEEQTFTTLSTEATFITTWVTEDGELTIPTFSGETYNYNITWTNLTNAGAGDGATTGETGDYTITGLENGDTYQVEISGAFPRIYFAKFEGGPPQKILTVAQWGDIAWASMSSAFYGCTNLTVPATDAPDLSGVTDMSYMFAFAESFNQPINHWNVSNVTDLLGMFREATSFNQPINGWNISSVTDMREMFYRATSFNQPLNNWNVSNVTDILYMFYFASSFNQDISGWNVGNVTDMSRMFNGAVSFNQSLGDWDIGSITTMVGSSTTMEGMLKGSGLSTANYDATLVGWADDNGGAETIPTGIELGADGLTYCHGEDARTALVNTHSWTISGDAGGCPFVTTWLTDDGELTIPTNSGETYNYNISWINLTNPGTGEGSANGQTGDYTITELENGSTYQVEITGAFPRIYFDGSGEEHKILTVEQWGDIAWTSMAYAFYECSNLTIPATDAPDLSGVTSMSGMFAFTDSFNQPIGHWDVSNVTSKSGMFQDAISFNQDISGWDVSHVTDMSYMFYGAASFNQDISGWDVNHVTDMEYMFAGADSFNQPLNNWNVSSVTGMQAMFFASTSFNQPLDNWDVSNVTDIQAMFLGASSFNQSLGDWDISNVTNMSNMLSNSGLSTANYDATFTGWADDNGGTESIPEDITLDADGLTYSCENGSEPRRTLIDSHGWTINGDAGGCPFVTTWITDDGVITIPTTGGGYDYDIAWTNLTNAGVGDGSVTGQTGSYTISELENGSTYQVEITGDFPRIYFEGSGEEHKILTVEQWGDIAWTSMLNAFAGCSNLTVPATDAPDLSGVTDMSYMFVFAESFNQPISHWDVSNVTSMEGMLATEGGSMAFNQDIGDWDVSNVINMRYMFYNAAAFNQDISGWDVGNVTNMFSIFRGATSFNQSLGDWDIGSVGDMEDMLSESGLSAENYNATLTGWADDNGGAETIPADITLDADGLTYSCAGVAARSALVDTHGWTITGDAGGCLPFVTTWETTTAAESITIPTTGSGYSYTVDWGDGSTDETVYTGDASHEYATAGTYTVSITGAFPRIYFNFGGDKNKIMTVEQWGDIAWASMDRAFAECGNLTVPATDAPDLSGVTDMGRMFIGAASFNQSINHWDVGNITNMWAMFAGASAFNQPLGSWNVSSVTNMSSMFAGGETGPMTFNQPLSSWDVSSVTDMSEMFENSTSFNQPLNNWDVSSVTTMKNMFWTATSFNQDISSWDVGNVINMWGMFDDAVSFNQSLDNWDISSVTNMAWMFAEASSFNQDISNWDVGNVTDMRNMLRSSGLSTAHYDAALAGWADDNGGTESIPAGVTLGADGLTYSCAGMTARRALVNTHGWTIDGDTGDCPFITTWVTDDGELTIPTNSDETYSYDITWTNLTNAGAGDGATTGETGDYTITGLDNGDTYQVEISGDFPRIFFISGEDKDKIMTIEQWGDMAWTSMSSAFHGCNNLTVPATDAPDLSGVTDMRQMFQEATSFNQSIDHWDVSSVTSMSGMFQGATSFNQDISGWDVGNVTNMDWMFFLGESPGPMAYNQPLESWDVSSVTDMSFMFAWAESFNQPIGHWDVSSVTSMSGMFQGTTSFNQSLGDWDISSMTQMTDMLKNSGLSAENYSATLVGWADDNGGAETIPTGLSLGADGLTYSCAGVIARGALAGTHNWTISGDAAPAGECLPFITTWRTTSVNETITIPTTGGGYSYTVDWGAGSPDDQTYTGDATHQYGEDGTYTVTITGAFPRIFFDNEGDKDKIMTVEQWGDIAWISMERAFYGCSNLTVPATDAPDLSNVTNMLAMFANTTNFNDDLSGWDVSSVTNMNGMFVGAESFNQPLNNWDVSSVTSMVTMFRGATSFNQPLDNWDVSNVTNMSYMFWQSEAFNQNLGDWDVSSVTNMNLMFENATSFNRSLDSWNVSNVASTGAMFRNATAFNQSLGAWDISSVTTMENMLYNSGLSTAHYDATLTGWANDKGGTETVPADITLDADGLTYSCTGAAARNLLTGTHGWAITDAGEVPDETAPVVDATELSDIEAQCEVASLTAPTATDNCSGAITGTHDAILPIIESATVTWTFTDGSDNESTQTQEVVIEDTTAPVADAEFLDDITAQCEVASLIAPTATDNCSGEITGTHNATLPLTESTTIIWTFTDGSDNESTQTQEVVIKDTTAPVADVESLDDITAQCEVVSLIAPTATDNCSGEITGIHDATFPLTESTTLTWTFTDGSDNESTQTQNVVIKDTTAPELDVIGDQSVDEGTELTFTATATDVVCSVLTYSLDDTSAGKGMSINASSGEFAWTPTNEQVGEHPVTVIVSDGGLEDIETITITVNEVSKQNQTIIFDAISEKTYGDEPFELTATASSELPVSYTSSDADIATISGSTVTIMGAGTATITAAQTGDETYNPAGRVEQVLTVHKATAQVTITDLEQEADGSPKLPAVNTVPAGLSYSITYDGNNMAPSDAGSYEIVVTIIETNYEGTSIATFVLTGGEVLGLNPQEDVTIYPNPVRESFEVRSAKDERIKVFDLSGRFQLESRTNVRTDISQLREGIYLVELSDRTNLRLIKR